MESLRRIDGQVGDFLNLMAGKEVMTRGGRKVRMGGVGTETHGEDAQRLASKRGAIIAEIAKLRDMGVLDKNEYERLDDQLPDPSGWTSILKNSKNAAIAYEQLQQEIRGKVKTHMTAHPWLVPSVPAGYQPVSE